MLIEQGLRFMIIGMSVVFLFLAVMVIVMKLNYIVLRFFNRFSPEQEEKTEEATGIAMHSHNDVAVAIAAVKAYIKG
jgi:sodium pump decarboxylase gamma subunit